LIIGAGFGGLATALRLVQQSNTTTTTTTTTPSSSSSEAPLPPRIIVVDAKDTFTIGGLWQFVWNGRLTIEQVQFPLRDSFLYNHNHLTTTPVVDMRLNTIVESWDPYTKTVVVHPAAAAATTTTTSNDTNNNHTDDPSTTTSTATTVIQYDHIVVACGVVPDPNRIPGIEKHVNICTFTHVPRQQQEVQEFIDKCRRRRQQQQQLVEQQPQDTTPFPETENKEVTFVLAIGMVPYKCPVAPFEMTFLVEEVVQKHNLRDQARFIITCPTDWPMPRSTQSTFQQLLQQRNIEFWGQHKLTKIMNQNDDSASSSVLYFDNQTQLVADLIWAVHPLMAPAFVRSALPDQTKETGFVQLHNHITHTVTGVENTHVIGDCCHIPASPTVSVPKAGEFAWKMGLSVADTLLQRPTVYTDRFGKCLAELGFDKGVTVQSNFSAFCNQGGEPIVQAQEVENSEQDKIAWVNGYLEQIFGKHATLSLDMLRSSSP
jgi:sulfide:quinone oxidoreductase